MLYFQQLLRCVISTILELNPMQPLLSDISFVYLGNVNKMNFIDLCCIELY